MVLYQGIHHRAIGGEIRNLIGSGNDDLPIQDIIIGIVASVYHKGEVHHQTGRVAVAVGAGIGLVGRKAVVGKKLVGTLPVHDDASAGALDFRGDVKPITYKIEFVILLCVGINRDGIGENGSVGVLGVFMTGL
jgi:hypothetical protein